VFLVLLCNDRPVLGPWINSVRQNILAWTIVWSLLLLSLALTTTVFFPHLSTTTFEVGLGAGAALGIVGGVVVIVAGRRFAERRDAERVARSFGGLDPEQVDELDDDRALTRAERAVVRERERATWRTPALATLERPVMSPLRRVGLLTLRCYLVVAVVLVIAKVVELGIT
jgi:hypothetical protein